MEITARDTSDEKTTRQDGNLGESTPGDVQRSSAASGAQSSAKRARRFAAASCLGSFRRKPRGDATGPGTCEKLGGKPDAAMFSGSAMARRMVSTHGGGSALKIQAGAMKQDFPSRTRTAAIVGRWLARGRAFREQRLTSDSRRRARGSRTEFSFGGASVCALVRPNGTAGQNPQGVFGRFFDSSASPTLSRVRTGLRDSAAQKPASAIYWPPAQWSSRAPRRIAGPEAPAEIRGERSASREGPQWRHPRVAEVQKGLEAARKNGNGHRIPRDDFRGGDERGERRLPLRSTHPGGRRLPDESARFDRAGRVQSLRAKFASKSPNIPAQAGGCAREYLRNSNLEMTNSSCINGCVK